MCESTSLVLGVGYVGSALVARLLARGDRVVALENFFSTDESAVCALGVPPRLEIIRGSVADPAAVEAAFAAAAGAEVVYNLAAQASARADAAPPEYTESTNLRGPRLVLEAQARFGVRTQVYASSLRVYGDSLPNPAGEANGYGRFSDLSHLSKVYAEKLLEMYSGRGQLRGRSIRLGLVYGPAPVMKTDYRFMTAPNKFCLQAVCGENLSVWGRSRIGLIHVADAARALLYAADVPGLPDYAPLDAATEVAIVPEIARLVVEAAAARGLAVGIEPPLAEHPERPEALVTRLADLGFQPGGNLATGIAETLDHFITRGTAPGQRNVRG